MGRESVSTAIDRLFREGTLTSLSDGQLLDRYLKDRDEAAFEALVNQHGPMVLGLCRRMLRDPRDIEDAFQATFLVLVRKGPRIRDRGRLANWLYGVAYRVAVRARSDLLRRRSRETSLGELDPPGMTGLGATEEIPPALDQELNRLPSRYRSVLVLCYLKGLTHDQAADALGCPVGTVRSRLARGRDLLKRRLTTRGEMPLAAVAWKSLPSPLIPVSLTRATVAGAGRLLGGAAVSMPVAISVSTPLSWSASTLAQGVLTTMALTQIKLIGAGVVAAGVVLGGAGAGAWALGAAGRGNHGNPPNRSQEPAPGATARAPAQPAPVAAAPSPETNLAPPAASTPSIEKRLANLENKLDALLKLMRRERERERPDEPPRGVRAPQPSAGTTPPPVEVTPPANRLQGPPEKGHIDDLPQVGPIVPPSPNRELDRPAPPHAAQDILLPASEPSRLDRRVNDLLGVSTASRWPLKETEAQIRIALAQFERNKALFQSAVIGREQRDEPLDQLRLLLGRLEGWEEEMTEELERLKIERAWKEAELKVAEARHEGTSAVVARTTRVNNRLKGVAAAEDVSVANAENAAALGNVQAKEAETKEVALRINHVVKKLGQLKEAIAMIRKSLPEFADRQGGLEGQPVKPSGR